MSRWSVTGAAVACMALLSTNANAQTKWNEKTILKFSNPVQIPGKTLQPGSYVFKLADSRSDRNLMQVYDQSGMNLVATTTTVPIKRAEPNGDVVLNFADTPGSEPVALKAFFYPGTLYGHEFVYSDAEAREISQRTHKVVLSQDVKGSNMERGTLDASDLEGTSVSSIDSNGQRTEWHPQPDVQREWAAWVVDWRNPQAVGTSGSTTTDMASGSTTTDMARCQPSITRGPSSR